jgi:uncharacterized protein
MNAECWAGAPLHDRGPMQQLSFGRAFYPLDPRPAEIFLDDIAESLAKTNRFLGYTTAPYSVAQHCVFVSELIEGAGHGNEAALWGLMHDAAEAYTGDVTKPIKRALDVVAPGAFAGIEERIEKAISECFGLEWPMPAAVKEFDLVALSTEKRDLLWASDLEWGALPAPSVRVIAPWNWRRARREFLGRFRALMRQRRREIAGV